MNSNCKWHMHLVACNSEHCLSAPLTSNEDETTHCQISFVHRLLLLRFARLLIFLARCDDIVFSCDRHRLTFWFLPRTRDNDSTCTFVARQIEPVFLYRGRPSVLFILQRKMNSVFRFLSTWCFCVRFSHQNHIMIFFISMADGIFIAQL